MTGNEGKIGVVVAAYNAQRWLESTLHSVVAQSFAEWSCVVVDDGSKDDTAAVAQAFRERDSRIHLVVQANAGVSAARNVGASLLDADVRAICFLDSDDVLLPDALAALGVVLGTRPDAVGVGGWADYIDEDGNPIRAGEHARKQRERVILAGRRIRYLEHSEDTTFASLVAYGSLWPPATVLLRRGAFEATGGFDESLKSQEDWDLFLRMSRLGPFAFLDQQVARYRVNEGGLSRPYAPNMLLRQAVRRKAWEYSGNSREQRRVVAATSRAQEKAVLLASWRDARQAASRRDLAGVIWDGALAAYVMPRVLRRSPARPSALATRVRLALEWRAAQSSGRVVATNSPGTEISRRIRVLVSPDVSGASNDNPYLTLLYGSMKDSAVDIEPFSRSALMTRPDVVHVHWPEFLIRWDRMATAVPDVGKLVLLLWLARRRGAVIVWTGHDLEPHEIHHPILWRWFFRFFLTQTDLLISMGDGATDALRDRHPQLSGKPVAIIPHGHYRDVYAQAPDKRQSRDNLGLRPGDPVLLVFGQIRPYKNIPALLREWNSSGAGELQLLIAGQPRSRDLETEIRAAAPDDAGARLLLRVIDDDEVPELFAASDVVVLPYHARSALNSGVALLALSFDRPVVLSDSPAGRDLQKTVGATWVYICDGTPRGALEAARRALRDPRSDRVDLADLEWPLLSALAAQAYRDAIKRARSS